VLFLVVQHRIIQLDPVLLLGGKSVRKHID